MGLVRDYYQRKWAQEQEQRKKAVSIVEMMKKYYPVRYKQYKDSFIGEKAEPGKQVTISTKPPEGTSAWAQEVIKEYGGILSPQEEFQATLMKGQTARLKQLMKGGQPAAGQGPESKTMVGGEGPNPWDVMMGLQKPTDPSKQFFMMAKVLGLDIQKLQTEIASGRLNIARLAETRAGEEFKTTSEQRDREITGQETGRVETAAHHAALEKEATARLTEEEKARQQRRVKTIYNLMRDEIKITDKASVLPEEKYRGEYKARISAVRMLQRVDPLEAKSFAESTTEGILSSSRAIVLDPSIAQAPGTGAVLADLRDYLMTLSRITDVNIQRVLSDRFGYLSKKTQLTEGDRNLLTLWHRWLTEMGVRLKPLEFAPSGWFDNVLNKIGLRRK